MERIELMERYLANGAEVERLENLGVPVEKHLKIGYRRTNPRLEDIDRVIEIPGNIDECVVLFYSGEEMTVLKSYDDLCIDLNDLENSELE